jgi:hypothetical protein
VTAVRLKSTKKPHKPDVWATEIRVDDINATPALSKLLELVRKYEDLS